MTVDLSGAECGWDGRFSIVKAIAALSTRFFCALAPAGVRVLWVRVGGSAMPNRGEIRAQSPELLSQAKPKAKVEAGAEAEAEAASDRLGFVQSIVIRTTRVATLVLPTMIAILVPGSLVADPATTSETVAAANGCLARPNGPSPDGTHWNYVVDRASGRHCWYLRHRTAAVARSDRSADVVRSAPQPVSAPFENPGAERIADALYGTGTGDQPSAPSAAWPSAPQIDWESPPQIDWGSRPPVSEPVPPTRNAAAASTSPAAAAAPQVDMTDVIPPAPRTGDRARRLTVGLAPASGDPTHISALLGSALVLALILLVWLGFRIPRAIFRRHNRSRMADPSDWASAHADAQRVPGMNVRMESLKRNSNLHNDRQQVGQQEDSLLGLLRRLQAGAACQDSTGGASSASIDGSAESLTSVGENAPLAPIDLDEALAMLRAIQS